MAKAKMARGRTPRKTTQHKESYIALDRKISIQRWHFLMCRGNQRPILIHQGSTAHWGVVREQIEVVGRPYADADKALWSWMHRHEDEVKSYLRGLGSYRYLTGGRIVGCARSIAAAEANLPKLFLDQALRSGFLLQPDGDGVLRVWLQINSPDLELNPNASQAMRTLWRRDFQPLFRLNMQAVKAEAQRRFEGLRPRVVDAIGIG